jgi:hypothetical protein
MKGRPKPYRMRKPYQRKTGGGNFRPRGITRAPAAAMPAPKSEKGLLKTILQTMGFRVKKA